MNKLFWPVLLCWALLLPATLTAAAPSIPATQVPAPIAASFRAYIRSELSSIYPTYAGSHYQLLFIKGEPLLNTTDGWVKTSTSLHPTYKTEIAAQKGAPAAYQGVFEINATTRVYPQQTTKESAAKQTALRSTKGDTYKFIFQYENSQWRLRSAKSYDSILRRWFPLETDLRKVLRCPDEKH